ncbi:MAG: hypothetical protein J6K96_02360 [Treponema sp.]|nr:hypothetical protein [Treponema sp.]
MKKMMIALAGIVSVMMLASCQKEVEIDGDADVTDVTVRNYEYCLTGSGTVTCKEDGETKTYTVTAGEISWSTDAKSHTNQYEYELYGIKVKDDYMGFPFDKIVEYEGTFYAEDVGAKEYKDIKITDPKKDTFTVTGSCKVDDVEYTFDVTFKR